MSSHNKDYAKYMPEIHYRREDVDFKIWYSNFSKVLAKNYSLKELLKQLEKTQKEIKKATESSLRAIQSTSSMQSNSQRRAQTSNVVSGLSQRISDLESAIHIHVLFPEETGDSK